MKILILKPSSLGDVVQALPVLRLLKRQDPNRQIYWWISSDLAGLLHSDPDLAGVFLFQRQRWARPWHWMEMIQSVRQMRAHQFDWVIDLQALARSAIVAWFARGKLTVGLDDGREGAPALYDRVVSRPSRFTHAVDWYLEVLRPLGVPVHGDFEWLPARPAAAVSVRSKWAVGSGRWILLVPGARWLNKRWPVEHFTELVRQLAAAHPDVRFGILGGPTDTPLAQAICRADRERCLDLTGRTSLPELIEWIRLSALLVTNDTGPMHLGAALGKPVISIFGPTEPRRTGPYGQVEKGLRIPLPCAPCLKPFCSFEKPLECLRAIPPARVRAEVEAALPVE